MSQGSGDYRHTAANLRSGAILQRVRQELGRQTPKDNRFHALSQAEFGALLGAKLGTDAPIQSTISQWEGGRASVPAATLIAALQLLGDGPVAEELLRDLKRS